LQTALQTVIKLASVKFKASDGKNVHLSAECPVRGVSNCSWPLSHWADGTRL